MKIFFITIAGLILVIYIYSKMTQEKVPEYEKIANRITHQVAAKLKKEKDLQPVGTGGGMMHDIYMMALSFDYEKEVDLSKARELLVYVVDNYLSAINSNEEVRPYLHDYPFTAKNIQIRIWVPLIDKIHLLEKFAALQH